MRIVILTQEDSFSIPRNIEKLIKIKDVEVISIINIISTGSLTEKKSFFIKGFGLIQSAKMGFVLGLHKASDLINNLLGYTLNWQLRSLKAVSKKYKIGYSETANPNQKEFLENLVMLHPDIVISFSAPVVFKEALLNLPKHGCINLHCSYLPHYAGLMPSFWTLYRQEKTTGCSVHYMDSKIDNGKILGQKKVEILPTDSMVNIIERTKEIGGELMCEVLKSIQNGTIIPKENDISKGSYNSWPSLEQFKDFKSRGGRLI